MNETIPPLSGSAPQPRTTGLAIWSLVLGILSLFCFSILTAIPGVICGHKALSKIKRSGGALAGDGVAIAGLVTGYLGILFSLFYIPLLLAIAIPNFVRAREVSMMNACRNNLRQIDAAKTQWALENRKTPGTVPTAQDLKPYLKNGELPVCPAGGTYTIGAIGEDPACSVPRHRLSPLGPGDAGSAATVQYDVHQAAAATPKQPSADAVGIFILAPYRTDMLHDPKRNLLYISAGDSVLRYQMASKSFLPPLVLGTQLRGIDPSPDNNLLAVADETEHQGSIGVYLVDLNAGTNTHVTFRAENMEGGTYAVAFGADGAVWITSPVRGSGWVPLRKYDPATRHVIATKRVRQNTMLAAGADREFIACAEANSSAGEYGVFHCRASQFQPPLKANAPVFEIGICRDGTQLAVPTYERVVLSGAAVPQLDERETIGVAHHPQRDFVFLARAGISTIAVCETTRCIQVKELDFGDKFAWVGNHAFQPGRLRLSGDGKYVFCTVPGGVRCAETGL